jgi:riboflavin kinase / FMN adenylyltransferase
MKIFYSIDEAKGIKNPVVTTGTFDGVHVGHQVIIRRLNKLAEDIGGESVLITFHPHPRKVLYPDTQGKGLMLICSQREKIALLEKTGLQNLIILNFTIEFSKITSHTFIEDLLIGKLKAKTIVVGFNHHFGYNREGDYEYLYKLSRKHGFEVEEIPEQDIQNESVSSTKIRTALLDGNIQRANAYLDHYYMIIGNFYLNEERTKELELTIFDIKADEDVKLVPPDGLYAVNLETNSGISKGMLSVSGRIAGESSVSDELKLEFYPLSEIDLQSTQITIYFHKRIRDKSPDQSLDSLKKQLARDIKEVEDLIY